MVIRLTSAAMAISLPFVFGAAAVDDSHKDSPHEPKGGLRFGIATCGSSALLVDGATGDTWGLGSDTDGKLGWVPLPRFANSANAKFRLPTVQPAIGAEAGQPLWAFLERQGYIRVKFRLTMFGYLSVKGKINGSEVQLLVDTGAASTHLDKNRTGQMHLKWEDHVATGNVAAKERHTSSLVVIDTLELGAFRARTLVVGRMTSATSTGKGGAGRIRSSTV